tara:strand:+ start:5100 stop:6227 length:1128 start_codon:yes stop_codon:yes gene_type:complete
MVKICWLSLDPINGQINFYPLEIARLIELKYKNYINNWNNNSNIFLGPNFFNATVNFSSTNKHFQTTPGYNGGFRGGNKPPGRRCVYRYVFNDDDNIDNKFKVKLICKWNNQERQYKIVSDFSSTNNQIIENSHLIIESFASNGVILDTDFIENITTRFDYWQPDDLNLETDKSVVVWEWCKSTNNNNNTIFNLTDNHWIPYLYDQNKEIEEAYTDGNFETTITLPFDNSTRVIRFDNRFTNSYAKQVDTFNNRIRLIRRRVILVSDLKIKLQTLNNGVPLTNSQIEEYVNSDSIPYEYICCISQCIMKEPVKTVDGHTYDRESIERWFDFNNTSPLTGLKLDSLDLIPNTELLNQIQRFINYSVNNTFNSTLTM